MCVYKKYCFLSLVSLVFCFCSCGYINRMFNLNDDNIFEETVEEVIKIKTGLDVDLTPDSEEW